MGNHFKTNNFYLANFLARLAILFLTSCNQGDKLKGHPMDGSPPPPVFSDPQGQLIQGFWQIPGRPIFARVGFGSPSAHSVYEKEESDTESKSSATTSQIIALIMPDLMTEPGTSVSFLPPNTEIPLTKDSNTNLWHGSLTGELLSSTRISRLRVVLIPPLQEQAHLKIQASYTIRKSNTEQNFEYDLAPTTDEWSARNQFHLSLKTKMLAYFKAEQNRRVCPISPPPAQSISEFVSLVKNHNSKCAKEIAQFYFCNWSSREVMSAYSAAIFNTDLEMEQFLREFVPQCSDSDKRNPIAKFYNCAKSETTCENRPIAEVLVNLLNNQFGEYSSGDSKFFIQLEKNDLFQQVLPLLKKSYLENDYQVDQQSLRLFWSLLEMRFFDEAFLLANEPSGAKLWQAFVDSSKNPNQDPANNSIFQILFTTESPQSNVFEFPLLSLESPNGSLRQIVVHSLDGWSKLTPDQIKSVLLDSSTNLNTSSFRDFVGLLPPTTAQEYREHLRLGIQKKIGHQSNLAGQTDIDFIQRRNYQRMNSELLKTLDWISK